MHNILNADAWRSPIVGRRISRDVLQVVAHIAPVSQNLKCHNIPGLGTILNAIHQSLHSSRDNEPFPEAFMGMTFMIAAKGPLAVMNPTGNDKIPNSYPGFMCTHTVSFSIFTIFFRFKHCLEVTESNSNEKKFLRKIPPLFVPERGLSISHQRMYLLLAEQPSRCIFNFPAVRWDQLCARQAL